jgi:uncharacterized repeat protein (TIGR01451 family)
MVSKPHSKCTWSLRAPIRLLLALVVLILPVKSAFPGIPTLTTIQIDGDMSDWSAVLANPDNVFLDGPTAGLLDQDFPSTPALDIAAAAFTWDATNIYFYVRRQASSSTILYFWFLIDADNDGRFESGEPVLRVRWKGNTGKTGLRADTYQAADPILGDPVTSGGSHDGYVVPGTTNNGPAVGNPNGGSASGLEMESFVPWATLGVAPGSPFTIHISSTLTQQAFPAGIEDNLGGDNFYSLVILDPDLSFSAPPPAPIVLSHTLTAGGNISDAFELTWTSTGDFTPSAVTFYADLDSSGTLTAGDVPLGDTTGDGNPDTGQLAGFGTLFPLLAEMVPPGAAQTGDQIVLTLRATSDFDATVFDIAIDSISLSGPLLTLVKVVDKATAAPGETILYTITYTNTGNQDALNVEVTDLVPNPAIYVAGSAAGAGMTITFSHDGGLTFDGLETLPVTHVRWSLPGMLVPSVPATVNFAVLVP